MAAVTFERIVIRFTSCCDETVFLEFLYDGTTDYGTLVKPTTLFPGFTDTCYRVNTYLTGDWSGLNPAPSLAYFTIVTLDPEAKCTDYTEECPDCQTTCYTLYNCDGLSFNSTNPDLYDFVGDYIVISAEGEESTWLVLENTGYCNSPFNDFVITTTTPTPCPCKCYEVTGIIKQVIYIDCDDVRQTLVGVGPFDKFCSQIYPIVNGVAGNYQVIDNGNCVDGDCPLACYKLTNCDTGEIIYSTLQSLFQYVNTSTVVQIEGYEGCWSVKDSEELCDCPISPIVVREYGSCGECLPIIAYKLTGCENPDDIKYTYQDLSLFVGEYVKLEDCGCFFVELIDFQPPSITTVVILTSFNSCTACLTQYYMLEDCNGVEDPIYTYTDLSSLIPPVIGCDCISVTYTLIGEEPVTVEVGKKPGLFEGRNYYEIVVDSISYFIAWNVEGDNGWAFLKFGVGQATLSEDTPCPFGTYTILEGSLFESFEVAPCYSIPVIKIKGCDTCWEVTETNIPVNPGIVTVTAFFPDCPSCTPPLPCLCNRLTNYGTTTNEYEYIDCNDDSVLITLKAGESTGKICLKRWVTDITETDNLEIFGECSETNTPGIYACPIVTPKRKIKPGYSVPTCDIDKWEKITCRASEILYKEVMRLRYGLTNCCPEDDEKWLIKKELIDLAALVDPDYICKPVQSCGCPPSSCGCGCNSTLKTCNSQ